MPIKHGGSKLEEVYTPEKIRDALSQFDEPATAGDIAKIIGSKSPRYVKDKMKALVEEGYIEGKNFGNRWLFWVKK